VFGRIRKTYEKVQSRKNPATDYTDQAISEIERKSKAIRETGRKSKASRETWEVRELGRHPCALKIKNPKRFFLAS